VYHLNQNATQIIQNIIASGASQKIIVSFDTLGEIPPTATNEVFRSSTSGDLTGSLTSIVLTKNGKITRFQSSPTAKFASVVIRTLTPYSGIKYFRTACQSGNLAEPKWTCSPMNLSTPWVVWSSMR
jgi:hypothetical protein